MKRKSPLLPWLIWAASAVFVLFQFFIQLSSGIIVNDLMHSFSINALGAGILASTYYYVYVTLQTPAGMLIDRYGPRILLAGGGFVCALGCWIFAASQQLTLAEIGRIFMGAGSSFAFVGSMYLISQWFEPSKFATMVGIAETIGTAGTIVGNIFLATLLHSYGWRQCMFGAALIALLIGFLCWFIIRDKPEQAQSEVLVTDTHFAEHVIDLLKSSKAWLNGIYAGLMFSVVTVFVALWGIPFLVKAHNVSILVATFITSFLFLGMAVGCPIVGYLNGKLKNRKMFLVSCAVLSAIFLTAILLMTNLNIIVLDVLMFLVGLLCSSYVLNYAISKELVPDEAISTSIGFTNTLAVITAPIMQPIVGAILHGVYRLHHAAYSVENYTIFDFQIALMILPIGLLGAAIMALYLD